MVEIILQFIRTKLHSQYRFHVEILEIRSRDNGKSTKMIFTLSHCQSRIGFKYGLKLQIPSTYNH